MRVATVALISIEHIKQYISIKEDVNTKDDWRVFVDFLVKFHFSFMCAEWLICIKFSRHLELNTNMI